MPPEKFDGNEAEGSTGICCDCPLYFHDNECFDGCILNENLSYDEMVKNKNRCPIRKHFV